MLESSPYAWENGSFSSLVALVDGALPPREPPSRWDLLSVNFTTSIPTQRNQTICIASTPRSSSNSPQSFVNLWKTEEVPPGPSKQIITAPTGKPFPGRRGSKLKFAPRSVRLAPLGFLALFKLRLLWHYLLFLKLTRKPSIDEGLSVGPFPLRRESIKNPTLAHEPPR